MKVAPRSTTSHPGASAEPSTAKAHLGLITRDESLVEDLGAAVGTAGIRLVVGSGPDSAADLLGDRGPEVCVFDTGCDAADVRPIVGGDGDLVVQVREPTGSSLGHARARYQYRREALPHLLRDLSQWLPGLGGHRDAVERIVGRSPAIDLVREQIRSVATFPELGALIVGEAGTGRHLVARTLHAAGPGTQGAPLVTLDCAALDEASLAAELFGRDVRAEDGARGVALGLLETAAGGTILLASIESMGPAVMRELLRVIESREIRRQGGEHGRPLRARVVAATVDAERLGATSGLRWALARRLADCTLRLPPLRERGSDTAELVDHFVTAFRARRRMRALRLSADAAALLLAHDWPGHVRQLRAVVDHACILSRDDLVTPQHVRSALSARWHERAATEVSAVG